MKPERARRIGAWLAGAWFGEMAGIGFVAAPTLFAALLAGDAGRVAARLFGLDATIGLAAGALLAIVGLQVGQSMAERQAPTERPAMSRFSAELALALAALACIVVGFYALQPLLEAARTGQGTLSFGTLHLLSTGLFGLRLGIVGVLAWRLGRRID
ncbi:MAG: DUF4149 domain-containing protein [Pseudomonadota bacterium]|nr:DUF4149 domain-containing protein [Pseudomonadota bacterium]